MQNGKCANKPSKTIRTGAKDSVDVEQPKQSELPKPEMKWHRGGRKIPTKTQRQQRIGPCHI